MFCLDKFLFFFIFFFSSRRRHTRWNCDWSSDVCLPIYFTALWDVSLRVAEGEAVAVVGPNGAGKTTLLRVISGLIAPRSGRIAFEGAELAGHPPHDIVAHGIAHVPEGRRLFPGLTVADNLKMGAFVPAD